MISQMEIVATKEAPQEYKDGLNPLELYLKGSIEERSDIILNHPDVRGYIYVHDRIVTKAMLPKKVVKYDTKDEEDHYSKVIVATSGTVEDYVPFYAPENAVLSDNHHLEVSPKQHNDVKTCSFAKYAKEHKQKLNMPTNLLGDKYIKNLHILAFLVVLPLLRSHDFQEGHYASNRRKLL